MSLPGSPPRWAPTHVQVTVLRARGLRAKGGGGSDAYALMALGKEKFATSVAERCLGAPVWREEAAFELPPPRRPGPAAEPRLQLTVLHRALLGLDKFLGRADIGLAELLEEGGRRSTRWYTLHSKPGKKEKERGEIEVDIQFTRSNMTASMFDLSMKDKSRSPFGKLKGKLKVKRTNGLPDTASAIIPSITHSPADSEEESSEKDKKKSKFKTLFSKPGLQKTSLSQSMSVLPPFQTVTEKVRLKPSDFQSKWGDDDDDDDEESASLKSEKAFGNKAEDNSLHVPVLMAHKRTASEDNKQLNQITSSNTKKEGLSLFSGLKSKNPNPDPTSRSNVCINGNHVYRQEGETKKETMPKDNTPSSSPQMFRKIQPSESEENLSSKSTKVHEKSGRISPIRGLPGSPSLESFKSMTLPSYKLLSGGDLLENTAPLSLEMTKEETKEEKKQENKKTLLSLVTGRKEIVKNSDVENMSDMTLKKREANPLEEKKNEKEVKPIEIPKDSNQGSTSENSSIADVPKNKQSRNPFDEEVTEEQKPEKSAASARTIQTKAVKPRLGVSSEDETKATLATSVPNSLPAFPSAHHSSSDSNLFAFKAEQKFKAPDSANSSMSLPPSLVTVQCSNDNNMLISDKGQEYKTQVSESFTNPLLYSPHPPTTLGHGSPPLLSSHLSVDINPFVSNLGQESKGQDLKSFTSPPSAFSLPSAVSSKNCCSFAKSFADSENPAFVPSESQNASLITDTNTVSNYLVSLSENPSLPVYERIGQALNKQCDAKEVQIVSLVKKNNRGIKQSVTFPLAELENTDSSRSHAAALDREQHERGHPDQCEERFTTDPATIEKREGFASVLDMKCYPSSKLSDESRNSIQNNESTVLDDIDTNSTSAEMWKDCREPTSLSQSNYNLSPRKAVIQPFFTESKLNEEQEICSGKKIERSHKMGEFGLTLEATHAVKSGSSLQVEPPKPIPRVHTLLPKDANKSEDVTELNPLFAKPKPTPRKAVKLNKCAPVSLTDRLKDEEMLIPSDSTMSGSGFVFHNGNPLNPHENSAGDSLLKTATLSTTHLGKDDSDNGHLKHKAYDHDDSLFDCRTDLRCAFPDTADQNRTLVGLPVIPEVGSDDELLDNYKKNNETTAIYRSFPSTENQCIESTDNSLSVTEDKLSSDMSSTDRASILLQEEKDGSEDTFTSSESSKLNSEVDIHSASNKISELGLDTLSYPSEHECGVEEQERKESSSIKETRKSDFFEPSEKSVSFTSLSGSSQLSAFSSSLQSGTCNSTRAESVKKPSAESFSDKAENAGKKKLLQARVSPSETFPNRTQQSDGSVPVKHRPHPVKPMNTTANNLHTKNLIPSTKVDEKWTESNRKKYDPSDPAYAYAQLTHDELIQLVLRQKDTITKRELQVRELEDYIDNLLVRVMEETPNILRATSQMQKAGRI